MFKYAQIRLDSALSNASFWLGACLAESFAERSIPECFRNEKTDIKVLSLMEKRVVKVWAG